MTDAAAPNPRSARRMSAAAALALAALALAALALAACGSQKSTLPPAPDAAGTVALSDLARHPEVYANATVAAVGTVVRTHQALYVLAGARGTRIVLEPTARAARYAGRRVRVRGIFTVTFNLGYEILVSNIRATATL